MDDERYGTTLFRVLDGEPGPSTVDVRRAVADGERHHRRARLAGATAAAAAVLVVVAASWAVARPARQDPAPVLPAATSEQPPPRKAMACVPEQLTTPAGHGPKAVVSGGDPTGRYLVGRSYPGTGPATVIWVDRQPQLAPMPGEDGTFSDVTSTGVAVGDSFSGERTVAYAYEGGKFTRLAGTDTTASAINEARTIAGSVGDRPALWASPTAQPTMLALPGAGWSGIATGIDEDGTVVGQVAPKLGQEVAVLWRPDGRLERLPAPDVRGKPANTFIATSIRDGWVTGWAARDEPGVRYIAGPRWNLRDGTVTSLDGLFSTVNRDGWMLGSTTLHAGDQTVELPPPPGFSGRISVHAYTLSDDGRTVAGQVSGDGDVRTQPVPIVWTCG
ncbi:hypothetical protein ABZS66_27685 [Dactylosporangium sp. NPDC005572]|uniref:hypothetical protein n=1 Tax=Dactylosporangium sp. NPDC005572 TaxID=3156889 RepID=UPI0033B1EDDC